MAAPALRAALTASVDMLDLAEQMRLAANTFTRSAEALDAAHVGNVMPSRAAVRHAKAAAAGALAALVRFDQGDRT